MPLPTPTFEHKRRWLRPRSILHSNKWTNILQPTGTTNALQDHLVETRLRCISARTWQAARLGGEPGSNIGRLYDSWESCSRFHSQADGASHADIARKARKELRNHPVVLSQLSKWWEMMLTTFPKMTQNLAPGKTPGMDEDQYCRWQLSMHRVLSPWSKDGESTFDYQTAKQQAAEDWQLDLKGEELLRKNGFCDALFAIADEWTRGIHPGEYAIFLSNLFDAVIEQEDTGNGFRLNEVAEIDDLDWNLSTVVQNEFAASLSPRAKPSRRVYTAGTTASRARLEAHKAEREAKLAVPPPWTPWSDPIRPPPPSRMPAAGAALGPELVHGRLRSAPRPPSASAHPSMASSSIPRTQIKGEPIKGWERHVVGPSFNGPTSGPTLADADKWFERAQQWLVGRGEPCTGISTSPLEHAALLPLQLPSKPFTPKAPLSPRNAGVRLSTPPPMLIGSSEWWREQRSEPRSPPSLRPHLPYTPPGTDATCVATRGSWHRS